MVNLKKHEASKALEKRIDMLEKQVRHLTNKVFPPRACSLCHYRVDTHNSKGKGYYCDVHKGTIPVDFVKNNKGCSRFMAEDIPF